MDGTAHENSDSDSGDSWTLLDTPACDTSPVPNDQVIKHASENHEKDEDTDGISIISDSDPETPIFSNLSSRNSIFEEDHPTETYTSFCIPAVSGSTVQNIQNKSEIKAMEIDDDFLGDSNGKHKIYVHRRNKKISTVLNIIMLGSIITAAGVAFGHLWGGRNECSPHNIPSVNKILSNLYKLQEENAYLRNKLKELTSFHSNVGNLQQHHIKQNKCRKVFEEPLQNNNGKYVTKCVDDKINNLNINNDFDDPAFEKEFVDDLGKLKNIYIQNKSLLDKEINRRVKQESNILEEPKNSKLNNKINKRDKRNSNSVKNTEDTVKNSILNHHHRVEIKDKLPPQMEPNTVDLVNDDKFSDGFNINVDEVEERKVSYADSLKSKVENKFIETENINTNENKAKQRNKKHKEDNETIFDKSLSDEDLKKDNRYIGQKYKRDRQKHDRHKSHKKQKRRNKYEQWEMKGGLMRDYDELSILSNNENEHTPSIDKNLDTENKDNPTVAEVKINKNSKKETDNLKPVKHYTNSKQGKSNKTGKKLNWYEERAIFRNEARKLLEQELFGESPSTAGWYFRRMQKREQCRAKADNTTYRKFAKQNMNFKMKH